MKIRTVEIEGHSVDLYQFSKCYLYPQFNGNAEFECTTKGFKALRHYLRTVNWINTQSY
jgi:hypothetical protein